MPTRSSSSAGAIYLDKGKRLADLRDAVTRARRRVPAIRRVILFGSHAAGTPTPASDADLLIVVDESATPTPSQRIPEMLAALSPLPCPVDLFVLTAEEVERARTERDPLVREALDHGMEL